jgi:hypothetical protein
MCLKEDIANISRCQATAVNPLLMCRWMTPITRLRDAKIWTSSAKPSLEDTNRTPMETAKAFHSANNNSLNPSAIRLLSHCSLQLLLLREVVEFYRVVPALVLMDRRG